MQEEKPIDTPQQQQQSETTTGNNDQNNENNNTQNKPEDVQNPEQQKPVEQEKPLTNLQKYKQIKLIDYKNVFTRLLQEDLKICPVRELNQDELQKKFEELKNLEENQESQKLNILKYLCISQVENSTLSLPDLVEKIKNYCNVILEQFKQFLEKNEQKKDGAGEGENQEMQVETPQTDLKQYEILKQVVGNISFDEFVPQIGYENKDYGYQNNIAVEVQNLKPHKIIEVKVTEIKDFTDDIEEIKHVRALRQLKKNVLIQLNKLIKQIEKTKKESDVSKIDEIYTKYQQYKAKLDNPPEKKVKKTVTKRGASKDRSGNESDSSIKSQKKNKKTKNNKVYGDEEITKSMKKMKLDSNQQTPSKIPETSEEGQEQQQQTQQPKKSAQKQKKTPIKKEPKKEDKSTRKITSFFQLKPGNKKPEVKQQQYKEDSGMIVESENNNNTINNNSNSENLTAQEQDTTVNLTIRAEKKEKPLFRKIGSNNLLLEKSFKNQEAVDKFNKVFENKEQNQNFTFQDSLKEIKELSIQQQSLFEKHDKLKKQHGKLCRKIFVIFDGSKFGFRNSFFTKSSKIINRLKPLAKDEKLLDYEKESDEELEDQEGEDLDKDSEDEESGEDKSQIEGLEIVSDGYLSNDEGIASDEELRTNKIENYNIKFEKKLEAIKNQEDKSFIYINTPEFYQNHQEVRKVIDNNTMKIIEEYEELPLKMVKNKEKDSDPFHKEPEIFKEFIIELHGSYKNRDIILNKFQNNEKQLTKSYLKKKILDISTKEKVGEEKTKKYMVYKSYLEKFDIKEEQIQQILTEKKEAYEAELKEKKEKKAEERKLKKQQEREQKKELQSTAQKQQNQKNLDQFMQISGENQKKVEGIQNPDDIERIKKYSGDCEILLDSTNNSRNFFENKQKETPKFNTEDKKELEELKKQKQQQQQTIDQSFGKKKNSSEMDIEENTKEKLLKKQQQESEKRKKNLEKQQKSTMQQATLLTMFQKKSENKQSTKKKNDIKQQQNEVEEEEKEESKSNNNNKNNNKQSKAQKSEAASLKREVDVSDILQSGTKRKQKQPQQLLTIEDIDYDDDEEEEDEDFQCDEKQAQEDDGSVGSQESDDDDIQESDNRMILE